SPPIAGSRATARLSFPDRRRPEAWSAFWSASSVTGRYLRLRVGAGRARFGPPPRASRLRADTAPIRANSSAYEGRRIRQRAASLVEPNRVTRWSNSSESSASSQFTASRVERQHGAILAERPSKEREARVGLSASVLTLAPTSLQRCPVRHHYG